MQYYVIKYVNTLPNGFGGTAQGPVIRLQSKYKDDAGLIEHEKTHVRQWYAVTAIGILIFSMLTLFVSPDLWPAFGLAPCLHPLLYRLVRPYRRWSEVQAYRKQIATGGYNSHDFAETALVEKYGLRLSVDEARTLLTD